MNEVSVHVFPSRLKLDAGNSVAEPTDITIAIKKEAITMPKISLNTLFFPFIFFFLCIIYMART